MVCRSLIRDAMPPDVFVMTTAQQLLDAVSSTLHIELRAHLDLRNMEPHGDGTILVGSNAGLEQVIWVCTMWFRLCIIYQPGV